MQGLGEVMFIKARSTARCELTTGLRSVLKQGTAMPTSRSLTQPRQNRNDNSASVLLRVLCKELTFIQQVPQNTRLLRLHATPPPLHIFGIITVFFSFTI